MSKQLKCKECNSDIIKIITYTDHCVYDEQQEGFKLEHIEPIDTLFKCSKCETRYNDSEIMEMLA